MDPTANLKSQRHVSAEIIKIWDACDYAGNLTAGQQIDIAHLANRLVELVQALDGWIAGGGFLPDEWQF